MNVTSPKISVIIPLYNTEDYIVETLWSIVNQSLKEIDIIIINDGSTDGSLSLVEEVKDERIRIYSQKNMGLSDARNKGLKEATGEYIYFMDSDDILEQDALEKCYIRCRKDKLDFVFFNAVIFNDNEHLFEPDYYQRTIPENKIYNGPDVIDLLMTTKQYRVSACLSVIRKSYLDSIKLTFYSKLLHEDELFTTLLYVQAKRVGFINKSFFHRRVRPNSIIASKISYRNFECYFIVADKILQFAKDQKQEIKITLNNYLTNLLNAVIYKGHKLGFSDKLKVANIVILKHLRYIKIKSIIILFLKK